MAGLLVYDGDCGFCTRCASLAARILPASVTITPWQHLPDLDATGLTEADVADASWWIGDDGAPRGGAAGIAAALRESGPPWSWLGALMQAPGARVAAAALYRWTARNRYRLPGGTPACALPGPVPAAPVRGPGRAARLLTIALLVAVVGAAATSTEAWPLTGWKLFSGTRAGTQAGFEVVAVDGVGNETPLPLTRFGRAYRGQSHLLQQFPSWAPARRSEACRAWAAEAERVGVPADAVRVYLVVRPVPTDGSPAGAAPPLRRNLRYECSQR